MRLAANPLKDEYVWSASAAIEEMAETLAPAPTLSFILTMYLPSMTFAPRGTRTGAGPERVAGAARAKGSRARRVEERILKYLATKREGINVQCFFWVGFGECWGSGVLLMRVKTAKGARKLLFIYFDLYKIRLLKH